MKVHQISNTYSNKIGGAEKLVRFLHLSFLLENRESYVVGLLKQPDPQIDFGISFGSESAYSIGLLLKLKRYFQESVSEYDIVHAHLFPANFYCAFFKKVGVLKCVLITTEHNTYNRRRQKWYGKILDKFIYSAYDKIIAISNGTQDALTDWIPELKNKVTVIYNGCELAFEEPITKHQNEEVVMVSVGSLTIQKNYTTVLRALASKSLKDFDFKWLIAGEGNQRNEIEILRNHLGLDDKVILLGRVDPIENLLKEADIFIMCSSWEGFGLAAVEAMNASLPCVLSSVSGLNELVSEEGKEALFASPDNPEEIADKIAILLKSFEVRVQMGRAGFERATLFDINKMVSAYLNVYKDSRNVTE